MIMSEPIKFIVIMATYNRCERLPKAVRSLIEQTYPHWHLVLVDDGSEDDTALFFEQLKDERIHCFSQGENKGVNAARNRALDEVFRLGLRGYITLLDDDDSFAPDCFELASRNIKRVPNYNWYTADCVNMQGGKISRIRQYGKASYLEDNMFGKRIRGDQTHFILSDELSDVRFSTRFKNAEEWYFFCQLAAKNDMYMFDFDAKIVEVLPTGLMRSGLNRDKAIDVLRYKIESLSPYVDDKRLVHQYVSLVKHLLAKKELSEATVWLKKAFKVNPYHLRQYRYWIRLLINQLSSK